MEERRTIIVRKTYICYNCGKAVEVNERLLEGQQITCTIGFCKDCLKLLKIKGEAK